MKHSHLAERGQVLILMVFLMIVILAFVGLAIDGGRLLTLRRRAQNAVDAASLSVAYTQCLERDVEPDGDHDSDDLRLAGEAAALQHDFDNNGVDNTVAINIPPTGGSYAGNAEFVEVVLVAEIPGSFSQLVYSGPLQTTVRAVAHCNEGSIFDDVEKALHGLGPCPDIKGIDGSGSNSEILGGTHSNDDVYISGSNNHFHGTTSSVEGTTTPGSGNQFDPGSPAAGSALPNPLASLTTSMYGPGGSRVQGLIVHDLSSGGKVDIGRLKAEGLYDDITKALDTGVYYAGSNEIELGDSDMHGTVTLVTENHIKMSGSRIKLEPYVDGMVMFSNKQPAEPCKDWVIDAGGSGTDVPVVTHDGAGQPTGYTETDNYFHGLVYAPRGQVMTSGSKSTIRGAIIGQGIKLNGSNELIVYDDSFFPEVLPSIFQDE